MSSHRIRTISLDIIADATELIIPIITPRGIVDYAMLPPFKAFLN